MQFPLDCPLNSQKPQTAQPPRTLLILDRLPQDTLQPSQANPLRLHTDLSACIDIGHLSNLQLCC